MDLSSLISSNQIFAGAVGGGIVLGLLNHVKSFPFVLVNFIIDRVSSVIAVHSGEYETFEAANKWLDGTKAAKWAHRYRLRQGWDEDLGKSITQKTMHYGNYWFLWKGMLCKLRTWKDEGQAVAGYATGGSAKTRDFMEIRFLGHGARKYADSFVDELKQIRESDKRDDVRVRDIKDSYGSSLAFLKKDRLYPPVLKTGQLQAVEKDVISFLEGEQWYNERGIPYHRGILLYGPPGTGKTSLIRYVAKLTGKDIYYADTNAVMRADMNINVGALPKGSVVVVEDIDRIINEAKLGGEDGKEGCTMFDTAKFLNCLDGLTSPHGVLFIFTANNIENIDPAILRPGRIDLKLLLDEVDFDQANELHRKFFGNYNDDFAKDASSKKLTPAQIQEQFLVLTNLDRKGEPH